jgi:MoaA/NifB/PqqE/SkfB family radical SAM enzyme
MGLPRVRRWARAAQQVAHANVGRLSAPLKLNVALTYWCQYRCKTCNIWQRRPENELTTAEVMQFIARTHGVSWLDLTGGEIFLRKDISQLLEAIVTSWDQLLLLHFPTNGFLTDQIVRVCERLPVRNGPEIVVTVSIDGDEALNDEVRGIRGGYRRQIATFNALRQISGIRPVFGMTLSAFNVGHFEDTFAALQRDCRNLQIDDVHLNIAQVSSHYYGNADVPNVAPPRDRALHALQVYRRLRGRPRSLSSWLESRYLRHLEGFLQTDTVPMPCHSLRSSCFIDPWGTVFPCITYNRPLGSLRDTGMDLAPIWHSAVTGTTQREIWSGDCPQCWTACEAYQSIIGNAVRLPRLGFSAVPPPRRRAIPLRVHPHDPSPGE